MNLFTYIWWVKPVLLLFGRFIDGVWLSSVNLQTSTKQTSDPAEGPSWDHSHAEDRSLADCDVNSWRETAGSVRVNIFETFVWEAACSFGLGNDRIFLQTSSLYQTKHPQTKHLETTKPLGLRREWTRRVDALIICQRSEVHRHSMHQAVKTQSCSCRRPIRISNVGSSTYLATVLIWLLWDFIIFQFWVLGHFWFFIWYLNGDSQVIQGKNRFVDNSF